MKKLCLSLLLVVSCWLSVVSSAYAACVPGARTGFVCTALGDIPTNQNAFVVWVLARAMAIGGGIAFLLMIGGAIKLLTSSGNPEGVKAGGETITSALMGLLFIIFALFLLHLIGVDVLKIPGFSK